jgi:N-methylhydantoinase A
MSARLAVDIGGTFTDLALEHGGSRFTAKTLTTPHAPEQGVLTGVRSILASAGLQPADITILIHGTTLATNAVIERKGARTALITTEGFRDVLALGNESRYDQYDLNIVLPEPLVPRALRRAGTAGQRGACAAAAGRIRGPRADPFAGAGKDREHRGRFPARLRQPGA